MLHVAYLYYNNGNNHSPQRTFYLAGVFSGRQDRYADSLW